MGQLWQQIAQLKRRHLDPASLQFRLMVEIALLAVLSLGSIAVWTSWKMQQILIVSHTQNIEYIAARFARDVELYSEMLPLKTGLEKTINRVAVPGLLIWVKDTNDQLMAASTNLEPATPATVKLMSLADMPLQAQVYQVGDRYLVLCEHPVKIKTVLIGKVYLAQDVTQEQQQLILGVRSLAGVCLLATLLTMIAIGLRIHRLLRPLEEMSQMTRAISAEDLSQAKLQLSQAPTEVKQLAQTLNVTLSRLGDAWEQQRQFVSNVSHELRTPLTVVFGYLQSLLRRSDNFTEMQREALETAASETDRTIRLLQDLLDLARADSGYMPFHLERLLLNELTDEVIDMAQKVSDRKIMLTTTEPVWAVSDRSRLKQVLINLIDNAVKYSPADQPVIVQLERVDKQALIQIRDRGIGIPLADQNRIFDRFYRVDDSRSRMTGGHGLGLAIVKTLVEGMGGDISVRSKPGEGSTFTIRLQV
jgi:signal transduction histidine kinase